MKKCISCKLPVDEWSIKPYSTLTKTCSIACSLDSVGKEKQKEFNKETRAMKSKLLDGDIKFWKAKAQKVFNEYIRVRDINDGCISCDKPASWHGQWHASHWKSRGARPDLAFNEDNVHKSCSVCNNYMSGNVGEYEKRLINKIGFKRVDALLLQSFNKKMVLSDYKSLFSLYQEKVKFLRGMYDTDTN